MKALIIIDAQNEFTAKGQRSVPDIENVLAAISKKVEQFRNGNLPVIWIQHFNKPNESKAFVPGTWGSEFVPGFGPKTDAKNETHFQKNVYGAFTGTAIGKYLEDNGINEVQIAGFVTHGCVSTTTREAIMAGLNVNIDPDTTCSYDIKNELLGNLSAAEVKRSALVQLSEMGATVARS